MSAKALKDDKGWTDGELRISVKAYLEMYRTDQAGIKFNKSAQLKELKSTSLTKRSLKSISRRFSNISSVLEIQNVPYAKGYKPQANVGKQIASTIWNFWLELDVPRSTLLVVNLRHEPLYEDALALKEFVFDGIYQLPHLMKVGDPVVLALGGDQAHVSWTPGLLGVGRISKAPYDHGYDGSKPSHFRIDIRSCHTFENSVTRKEIGTGRERVITLGI